jgi:hypothetical protein
MKEIYVGAGVGIFIFLAIIVCEYYPFCSRDPGYGRFFSLCNPRVRSNLIMWEADQNA